LKYNRQLSD